MRRAECKHIREAQALHFEGIDPIGGCLIMKEESATDFVPERFRERRIPDPGPEPPMEKRHKISWIKWHRATTGAGLKEGKEEWDRRYEALSARMELEKTIEYESQPEAPKAPVVTDPAKMPWRDYVASLAPSARWRIA